MACFHQPYCYSNIVIAQGNIPMALSHKFNYFKYLSYRKIHLSLMTENILLGSEIHLPLMIMFQGIIQTFI